jgi:hypothetical protein
MGNPPPYLMLGIKTAAGTRHYRAAMQRAAQLQGQLDGADSKERERLNEQIGEIQKKALDEALALDRRPVQSPENANRDQLRPTALHALVIHLPLGYDRQKSLNRFGASSVYRTVC